MNIQIKSIRGLDKLNAKLKTLSAYKFNVKVGILSGATYAGSGQSVAYVAYLNEYGSIHNPPRPFLKETAENNGEKWVRGIAYNIGRDIFDYNTVKKAFTQAGIVARGDVKRAIMDWPDDKPRLNSRRTIERKRRRGRSGRNLRAIRPEKALVDTATMINAIHYEVDG
jgi:hypothetical protein